MIHNNCGNCNFHGQIKLKETWCLFWQKWVGVRHTCEHFVEFVPGMNETLRADAAKQLKESIEQKAREKRQHEEAERRHQEQLNAAKELQREDIKARWMIGIVSWVVGFFAGLLTRLIF